MSSRLREQVAHFYTLTDRFQVQLRVLGESHATVDQLVRDAGAVDDSIEAVPFLVLFEASRSAQDDLREILEQARAINDAKAKLEGSLGWPAAKTSLDVESVLQLMLTVYGKTIESELDAIQRHLDSVSELGEAESLRLQTAMDRLSKMMSTLSNILKRISDTADAIVQNMK